MSKKNSGIDPALAAMINNPTIDDLIFELIPRSTETAPPHGYGAGAARLRAIFAETPRLSGVELYEKFYDGRKKQSWSAFEKTLQRFNETQRAEGRDWGAGSTTHYGRMPLGEVPGRPRKKFRGPFEPST